MTETPLEEIYNQVNTAPGPLFRVKVLDGNRAVVNRYLVETISVGQ